ncbi:hypothetical protein [Mycobacterium hubeiense]|uniref:hypothetical protein n=1 Tax=Mycobacterium hubeiense TaxID=1867256 RepID=UPI003D677604
MRARGAFVLRMMMDPPWSLRIEDDAPLSLICQTPTLRPGGTPSRTRSWVPR